MFVKPFVKPFYISKFVIIDFIFIFKHNIIWN